MDERALRRQGRAGRSRRGARRILLAAGLLSASLALPAQTTLEDVPPIPASERFSQGDALAVSLSVSPARIHVDEVPAFTVSVTNVGREPVLVRPSIVANVLIYTAADELIRPAMMRISEVIRRPTTLDDATELAPGESLRAEVPAEHAGYTDSSAGLYEMGRGLGLAPGEYLVRFAYVNYPDYTGHVYDVTTDRAARMWEGRVESAPVRLSIQPPDADRLATVLASLQYMAPGGPAIRAAGVALADLVEPLLQRCVDDPNSRPLVTLAIAATGDAAAAARLLDLLAAQPFQQMEAFLIRHDVGPALVAMAPACHRLPWLLERWSLRWAGDYGAAIRALDAQCPDLPGTLREILRTRPPFDSPNPELVRAAEHRRGAAAAFLGILGDADAVAALAAALQELRGQGRFAGAFETVRREAVEALVRIGGPAAGEALLDAAINPANDNVLRALAEAIATVSPPGADAALARLLSRLPAEGLIAWSEVAGRVRGPIAASGLQALLDHPDPRVQVAAIRGLGRAGWPAVRTRMIELATAGHAADARPAALQYLVAQRDPSVVPLLGTADDARRVRRELERAADENQTQSLAETLRRLTFASTDWQFGLDRRDWDAWFRGRDGQTRADWAEEAIAGATAAPPTVGWWQSGLIVIGGPPAAALAVEYLASLPGPPRATLRRATTSPSWHVRIAASRALAAWDEPVAVHLLARELQNRYVLACLGAVRALAAVAEPFGTDCSDPASRTAAAAFYARRSP